MSRPRRERALWIGAEQRQGRGGAGSFGQEGWVYPLDLEHGLYIFVPDCVGGPYQVRCSKDDFLLYAAAESA